MLVIVYRVDVGRTRARHTRLVSIGTTKREREREINEIKRAYVHFRDIESLPTPDNTVCPPRDIADACARPDWMRADDRRGCGGSRIEGDRARGF